MKKVLNHRGVSRHLAVIFENHKLVCWGTNNVSMHAEVDALRKLEALQRSHKIKWNKLVLVVVRIKLDWKGDIFFSMSKPCMSCVQSIQQTRISHVCWSTDVNCSSSCPTWSFSPGFCGCRAEDLYSAHICKSMRYIWK